MTITIAFLLIGLFGIICSQWEQQIERSKQRLQDYEQRQAEAAQAALEKQRDLYRRQVAQVIYP